LQVAELGFLTVRGDMIWKDNVFLTEREDSLNMHEDHLLVNALVRFETTDGQWAVDLYGKNLGDVEHGERHVSAVGSFLVPAAPRIFGVQLVYNY